MHYLLWTLFGPASWAFWLILIGTLLLLGRSKRTRSLARLCLALAGITVFVLGILPTGNWLIDRLERMYPLPALENGFDRIAVLTGAEDLASSEKNGVLQVGEHGERILEALTLANRFPDAEILIIGGVSIRNNDKIDAEWTRDFLIGAGLAPVRIKAIGGSIDTCSNAEKLRNAVGSTRVLLVTSAFHLPRAMACMKHSKVNAVPYGVDFQHSAGRYGAGNVSIDVMANINRADLALHEIIGLAFYRLAGRI